MNPLASINGRATIVSPDIFQSKYPSGRVPRTSKDYGKIFICRRGCNTRTATYTEEFSWEDIYKGAEDLDSLVERVQSQTKATRKRKRHVSYDDDDAEIEVCYYLSLDYRCALTLNRKSRMAMTSQKPLASGENSHMPQHQNPNPSDQPLKNSPLQHTDGNIPVISVRSLSKPFAAS